MDWVTIGAAVLTVWVGATLLGNERQRRAESVAIPTPPPDAAPPAH